MARYSTFSFEEKTKIPEIEEIINQATSTSLSSGKPYILFFNIDEQSYVLVERDQTILKNVPDGVSYNKLSGDFKIIRITVNGYNYESGCPGITFFADGSREYAEIELESIEGTRCTVVLNPYSSVVEITQSS